MESYHMKKIVVGFITIGLLSVNGFYFFPIREKGNPGFLKTGTDSFKSFQAERLSYLSLSSQIPDVSGSNHDQWFRGSWRKYALDPSLLKAIIHAESGTASKNISPREKDKNLDLSPQELEVSVSTYDHWIKAACSKYGLEPALVKAIIHAESQFDPKAVSPRGAMGLMQLDPITIKELGVADPFNPQHNIYGGVRYFRDLLNTFDGNSQLALAAYNAGPSKVLRYNGVPPFKDTNKYIKQVFRYLAFYQKSQKG
ncbi:MAG TPA: lytic transglycosylase domain-containing protein [Thermodesulfobacteriota bacterium]|nr:lytic transglycosylase domain-containing protein [Thermodesulfobacteriota bacterium]